MKTVRECEECGEKAAIAIIQVWTLDEEGAPNELQDESARCKDCFSGVVGFSGNTPLGFKV
jgi:hypothetical protein